ncbi:MAG: PliI family lysozyme inhibitor of I-type lysozyme [Bacteroidales bacterium]
MKKFIFTFLGLAMIVSVPSCKQSKPENQPAMKVDSGTSVFGDYATSDYEKRSEGYDFVAVTITQLNDSLATVAVRSRSDKKQPTCRFDATGKLIGNDTLLVQQEGETIYFTLKSDTLQVTSSNPNGLYYYCSGGASLSQDYIKLTAPLDRSIIDPRSFDKVLNYGKFGFDVSVTGDTLTIASYGLSGSNEPVKQDITGYTVTNAEVGDLNIDGFPEVFVYLTSDGSGSYGKLIGYSVNNGKSMSQVCIPDITENKEASTGYQGHDEMAIVESTFCQRFPVYKDGDPNSSPTGGTRQIQYKLIDGEACRTLKIDKIVQN